MQHKYQVVEDSDNRTCGDPASGSLAAETVGVSRCGQDQSVQVQPIDGGLGLVGVEAIHVRRSANGEWFGSKYESRC